MAQQIRFLWKCGWLAFAASGLAGCGNAHSLFGARSQDPRSHSILPPPPEPGAPTTPTPTPAPGPAAQPPATRPAPSGDPIGAEGDSSYQQTDVTEPFATMQARLVGAKPEFETRQKSLLTDRYDLTDRGDTSVTMGRSKPVQAGVRVRLPEGQTWDSLAAMTPTQVRDGGLFPKGFLPLPHPKHEEGGMVFPHMQIDEIKSQEGRDLTRFDIDFDLPDQFLPEFPPALYLTTRPELGDVARGQLITNQNYFQMFDGVLTPKQLDGLRLLVTPFAQQQFNLTTDRRSDRPTLGVTCFDCHANGSTNAATHLDPVTRPQERRRRLDTPSLRGINIQRLFGSQRALKTVEDFTQFEQIGAYFDGDFVMAAKKGMNLLNRDTEVANMAEFQSLLTFPPAPKLDLEGKLDPTLATASELSGEALFNGKAQCGTCHVAPYYTDNSMHDLKAERFYNVMTFNGQVASSDGPIKTFPLRGIKETPPYLHDGRLLTLDDTVEFFNLVMGTKLTTSEKADVVAFMKTL